MPVYSDTSTAVKEGRAEQTPLSERQMAAQLGRALVPERATGRGPIRFGQRDDIQHYEASERRDALEARQAQLKKLGLTSTQAESRAKLAGTLAKRHYEKARQAGVQEDAEQQLVHLARAEKNENRAAHYRGEKVTPSYDRNEEPMSAQRDLDEYRHNRRYL
jgi:hypothetical protein